MINRSRWKKAQEYEQGFWEGVAREVAEGSLNRIGFYDWRSGQLRERMTRLELVHLLDGTARIAELGSGPVGIVGFLDARERVAVDPLNRFYASHEGLSRLRNPKVRYLDARGEALPLESKAYDLVIMENCIDHALDPDRVMEEVRRILRPGGVLYLTVNARSRLGYWVHRLLARLTLDPGHPHTFTVGRVRHLVEQHDLQLLELDAASWLDGWTRDLRGKSWKARAKGLLLVSEHLVSVVAKKARS